MSWIGRSEYSRQVDRAEEAASTGDTDKMIGYAILAVAAALSDTAYAIRGLPDWHEPLNG